MKALFKNLTFPLNVLYSILALIPITYILGMIAMFIHSFIFPNLNDNKYKFEIFNNFFTPIVTAISAFFVYIALKSSTKQHLDIVTLSRINSIESNLLTIKTDIQRLKYNDSESNKLYEGREVLEYFIAELIKENFINQIHYEFNSVLSTFLYCYGELNILLKTTDKNKNYDILTIRKMRLITFANDFLNPYLWRINEIDIDELNDANMIEVVKYYRLTFVDIINIETELSE